MADAPPTNSRSSAQVLLLGILLLALALRLYGIGSSSFWLDEFCSLETATGRGLVHVALPANVIIANPGHLTTLDDERPWWSIWTSMRLDNHPPLYFVLLRWWIYCVVTSEAAFRALSIGASLA